MATYTAKVEVSSKASGTTLASASFSSRQDAMLLSAFAYSDAQGHPTTVKWGNRLLRNRPAALTRDPATVDIAMSVWVQPKVKRISSHAVTGTWSLDIVERALIVGEVFGKNRIDQATGANFLTGTTDPITGVTAALAAADDLAVAYFVSEGPDTNDSFGTMEILDGGTWTAVEGTQRAGTNGAPPVSNVTITSGWLNLTSAQATNARLTGATSRNWTCGILTLKDSIVGRAGVSSADFNDIEDIFEAAGLNPEVAAFAYNFPLDRFEVFAKSDMATAIAYWDGGVWVTL